jgi:hypothetical protein
LEVPALVPVVLAVELGQAVHPPPGPREPGILAAVAATARRVSEFLPQTN